MLRDKKILLGVCGGIAAYKAVDLASRLTKAGAVVKIIMTEGAQEFVSPLTFRSITGQSVTTRLFNSEAPIEHVSLAEWSDLLVIAPATANIIGKISSGIADDLLTTTIMACTAPKLIVPAMNSRMWENPIVQNNINQLYSYEYLVMPPDTGRLACGYEGKGRFPEVSEIALWVMSALYYPRDLIGKKLLVTAGACREYLDPMRYISNESSGKMGLAIARAAYHRGAEVTLIAGHTNERVPYFIKNIRKSSAKEMYDETLDQAEKMDIIIMTAAVTDFQFRDKSAVKIKKEEFGSTSLKLEMQPTVDILKELGKIRKEQQKLIGFAAETDNMITNARKKLEAKNCDYIVANNISCAGNEETDVVIIDKDNKTEISGTKFFVAHRILDIIK
jgi:phosphopantothenoylcysteine decarboxylase/phosphopantothenate--cysteine ligase